MDNFPIKADISIDGTKIYTESIKPISNPTAELVGLVPRAVKAALCSLEKWILHKEYSVAETACLLNEKMTNVPPEKIISPEPYIAVPAINAISYSMDNKELRNLYANLLARAINADTATDVHPSFVEIIKQLSPLEAKILNYVAENSNLLPVCRVRLQLNTEATESVPPRIYSPGENFFKPITSGKVILRNYTYVEFCGERPDLLSSSLDNLTRLGLLSISYDHHFTSMKKYKPFLYDPFLLNLINSDPVKKSRGYHTNAAIKGHCSTTSLGDLFIKICVRD